MSCLALYWSCPFSSFSLILLSADSSSTKNLGSNRDIVMPKMRVNLFFFWILLVRHTEYRLYLAFHHNIGNGVHRRKPRQKNEAQNMLVSKVPMLKTKTTRFHIHWPSLLIPTEIRPRSPPYYLHIVFLRFCLNVTISKISLTGPTPSKPVLFINLYFLFSVALIIFKIIYMVYL